MNEHQSRNEPVEHEPTVEPKIYAASLSDYNAGRLHGIWLDAAQDAEALLAGISAMLAASPTPGAEEWAVHDYEGFGMVEIGEYESVERVSQVALGIVEHGQVFSAWANHIGPSSWDELDRFEDCYMGEWHSLKDYAEDLVDDLGLVEQIERVVPEGLRPYVCFDYEMLGRDMELGGDIVAVESLDGASVFIFSPL